MRRPHMKKILIFALALLFFFPIIASASTYDIVGTSAYMLIEMTPDRKAELHTSNDYYFYMVDDVASWSDLKSVCLGYFHAVGLKNDGTVVVDSKSSFSRSKIPVSEWRDIVDVGCNSNLYALKADGTVLTTDYIGQQIFNNEMPSYPIPKLTMLSVGISCAAGLGEDGIVYCYVPDLGKVFSEKLAENTIVMACGGNFVAALDQNGTVNYLTTGSAEGLEVVKDWKEIVKIVADDTYLYGLTKDGEILSTNKNRYLSSEVENRDFISIVPVNYEAVGMKADGKLYSLDAYPNQLLVELIDGFNK